MRGVTPLAVRRDDRGAVLVIFAAFAVVALIFVAFVVDIGDQRQNRRQLATETDAVALGVARDWADASLSASYVDCSDAAAAARLSVYNNPNKNLAADPTCTFTTPNPFQGYVTVFDGETAAFEFGGVTGVDEGSTGASTTVALSVRVGGGLRPLGLCVNDSDIQSWLSTGLPTQFDIFAPKFLDPLCTGGKPSPGNWSQVVLPPSKPNANDWTDDVENGAKEDVTVNDTLDNLPGVGMNSAEDEFEDLEGTVFFLPLYSTVISGPGSHVEYPVSGFLEVELIDVDISGSTPSFTIKPLRHQTSGTCCFLNGPNSELAICDVGAIDGAVVDTTNCLGTLPPLVTPTSPPPTCTASMTSATAAASTVTADKGTGKLDSTVSWAYSLPTPSACTASFSARAVLNNTTAATVGASVSGSTVTVTFPSGLVDFKPDRIYTVELLHGSSVVNSTATLDTETP